MCGSLILKGWNLKDKHAGGHSRRGQPVGHLQESGAVSVAKHSGSRWCEPTGAPRL